MLSRAANIIVMILIYNSSFSLLIMPSAAFCCAGSGEKTMRSHAFVPPRTISFDYLWHLPSFAVLGVQTKVFFFHPTAQPFQAEQTESKK